MTAPPAPALLPAPWPALPPPTPDVRRFVQALGPDAALAVIEARGGTRLWVPGQATGSTLVQELGEAATLRLVEAFGRGPIKVPVAREWRVQIYRARGMSYAQIARATGCSETSVHRILAGSGLTVSRQLDLGL
jgi:hypothetical protein